MAQYLYRNNLSKYIEIYAPKAHSSRTPAVLDALQDVHCLECMSKFLLLKDLGAATHSKAHPAVTGCGMDQSRQDFEIYNSLESSLGNSVFNDFLDHWKGITSKVMVDIVRVDNFEISGIADQAIRDSLQGLLPSTRAIGIYKKQGVHATTVNVLIEHVASIYHSHE
ncbi:MAG: hypothetical protein J3Q66DRAFT_368533 [Benniella sp.]|nr:MAG: hypothetical protein J3Q66DRAFT_368533 [Benniella sp.]